MPLLSRHPINRCLCSAAVFMSFTEQVRSHLTFLRENGLDVDTLKINVGNVWCSNFDYQYGVHDGQYHYRSSWVSVDKIKGISLTTWCYGPFNREEVHKTYGEDEKGE